MQSRAVLRGMTITRPARAAIGAALRRLRSAPVPGDLPHHSPGQPARSRLWGTSRALSPYLKARPTTTAWGALPDATAGRAVPPAAPVRRSENPLSPTVGISVTGQTETMAALGRPMFFPRPATLIANLAIIRPSTQPAPTCFGSPNQPARIDLVEP